MPRRTKACATCRQKRIKCDATMPHCLMCLKFGRKCPGPTDAPLTFIDTSSYPSGKKPRKKPSPPASGKTSASRPVANPEPSSTPTSITDFEQIQAASTVAKREAVVKGELPPELAYVTLFQISGKYVLNDALFANLARFFCAEGRTLPGAPKMPPSWLHALPHMAAQSKAPFAVKTGTNGKEALDLAIRATTAAFGGLESRNIGLLKYASGLYGEALRAQGRVVAGNKKAVGMDMVAASVMLGMFEAVVATTGRAYAEHVVGAAKMLDVAMSQSLKAGGQPPEGGKGCGDGSSPSSGPGPLLSGVFFHTRIQLTYVYLTSTEARIRNDPVMKRLLIDTCGWPYDKLPLNQQIIRPLAQLIELSFEQEKGSRERQALGKRELLYEEAKWEVESLWERYKTEGRGQKLCWTGVRTGHGDFRDSFTAIQYAYFSACRILLDVVSASHGSIHSSRNSSPTSTSSFASFRGSVTLPLRTSHSPPPQTNCPTPSTYPASPTASLVSNLSTSTTTGHYALILSAASYLRIRDVGFSYLRIHTPLFLVAIYAPKVEQRDAARRLFEEWERGALRGIGASGLQRINGER